MLGPAKGNHEIRPLAARQAGRVEGAYAPGRRRLSAFAEPRRRSPAPARSSAARRAQSPHRPSRRGAAENALAPQGLIVRVEPRRVGERNDRLFHAASLAAAVLDGFLEEQNDNTVFGKREENGALFCSQPPAILIEDRASGTRVSNRALPSPDGRGRSSNALWGEGTEPLSRRAGVVPRPFAPAPNRHRRRLRRS